MAAFWATEMIGVSAAVLGTLCWLPQSIKTIRSRDTKSLSLWTNVMLFTAMVLWLIYGIAIGSWPLVGSNLISAALVGVIVGMKIRYG